MNSIHPSRQRRRGAINQLRVDAFMPPEMAIKAETVGVRRARRNTLALAVLAAHSSP